MNANRVRRWRLSQPQIAQAGFSLIELMVSMLIGLVVLGALFAAFSSSNRTNRTATAMAQVTEDATLAMNLIRSQVRLAGYSRAVAVNAGTGRLTRAWAGRAVFGCDGPFADLAALPNVIACGAAGASDSLSIGYEMDSTANGNSLVGADGRPLDCLGNGVAITVDGAVSYFLAHSRFYLNNGGLSCRGPGNANGQLLVDNIQDWQLTYGVTTAGGDNVVAYKTATQINAAPAEWAQVMSVRACLVVRSADEVMDAITPYQGCNPFAAATVPADRRLYRAFTSTMTIQNRL